MTDKNSATQNKKLMRNLIGFGAATLVLIIAIVSFYSFYNGTRDEGIRYTTALEKQYSTNQVELSNYYLKFTETLGVADRQNAKLQEVILDAVKGRYDGDLKVGGEGALFSAITEAYPDLTASSESYQLVQQVIMSGRDAYRNQQVKLLDMAQDFEIWTQSGMIKSQVIKSLGFPGDYLEVRTASGETKRGWDAYDQILTLVLTEEAQQAYETGTEKPLISPLED